MEKSQMKNMVVLRNLPSNLIEEAIVVFKTVKSAKEFQYIDKIENLKNEQNKKLYLKKRKVLFQAILKLMKRKTKKMRVQLLIKNIKN